MVKKGMACVLVAMAAVAPIAAAATWTQVGTSGFSISGTGGDGENAAEYYITDANRIKISDMVVDPAGNVYAIVNNGDNTGTNNGGITIFKADGSVINVNTTTTYPGAYTKLVVAGDGQVYALQNWVEINWPGTPRDWDHKILRILPTGTVQLVMNATVWGGEKRLGVGQPGDRNIDQIADACVGEGGHLYIFMKPQKNNYWDFHMMWRYNIVTGVIEPSLHDGTPVSWGASFPRFFSVEYVGNGWFGLLTNDTFSVDAISWNMSRRIANNNTGASWGGDRSTVYAYDPVNVKLWRMGRSEVGSASNYATIAWRLNGSPANGGLFTEYDPVTDRVLGLEPGNAMAWHMTRIDPSAGIPLGGKHWPTAGAVNPTDGKLWFTLAGDKYLTGGINFRGNIGAPSAPNEWSWVGEIYTADIDAGVTYASEGRPVVKADGKPNAYVMALAFGKRAGSYHAFALTLDYATNPVIRLFRSQALTAPATGACCKRGNACSVETLGDCVALGGYYNGDGSVCGPDVKCVGACCQEDGCSQEIPSDCSSIQNTRFEGVGTDCADFNCPTRVCQDPSADIDGDGDVDQVDFGFWQGCITLAGTISDDPVRCGCHDVAGGTDGAPDGFIDIADFAPFANCGAGSGVQVDPACDD